MALKKQIIFKRKINFGKINKSMPYDKRTNHICICIFILAVLLKFGFYHFKYYPLLDDYIQYGAYHLYHSKSYVLFSIGTLFQRPFAGISDMYLWGMFRENLSVVFIAITILHVLSAFLFKKAFGYINIYLGNIFLIFYLLCPILSEATYWISASTRIVPGMFFSALSIIILKLYLKRRKSYMWLATFFVHFLSYGFYEQTMVFSFCVFYFYMFFYAYQTKEKIFSAITIPMICIFLFAVYYLLTKNIGNFSGRADISISWEHIFATAKRLIKIFTLRNLELTANGFVRGMALLSKRIIYLFAIIIVSLGVAFIPRETPSKNTAPKLILGTAILIFPFVPYLIINNSYPEFRSVYTAVMGAGIILDTCFERLKYKNILCSVLIFIFIVANVSEIHDYKTVYDIDQEILAEISSSQNLKENTDICVTGVKESYFNTNANLGAHIQNVTSSDWALTGAVRAYMGNLDIKRLIPHTGYDADTNVTPVIDISHIK